MGHHGLVLLVRLRVEHQLQRLVILEIAGSVIVWLVHLEVPAAQLRELPVDVGRRPIVHIVYVVVLRVGVEPEALALLDLSPLQHLVGGVRGVGSYRPLFHLPVLFILERKWPIISQLGPTLESVPSGSVINSSVYLTTVFLHILLRNRVAGGKHTILQLTLRIRL